MLRRGQGARRSLSDPFPTDCKGVLRQLPQFGLSDSPCLWPVSPLWPGLEQRPQKLVPEESRLGNDLRIIGQWPFLPLIAAGKRFTAPEQCSIFNISRRWKSQSSIRNWS